MNLCHAFLLTVYEYSLRTIKGSAMKTVVPYYQKQPSIVIKKLTGKK